MYNGSIQGIGPRYCPSIEDKINRFAERDRHQIFVEPEGWDTVEIYVNGFSTSLPDNIQQQALRLVPGFENAKIFRPGYAIEYDYFPPTQLKHSLETKLIAHLYFAGQINGTTGYEEAASQGLMAGINAHLKINEKESFVLARNEAYIGVLIDDLVTKGTDEPYRMFTSRAEYRISLRQDNADMRLTAKGYALGLATQDRMRRLEEKQVATGSFIQALQQAAVEPSEINSLLEEKGTAAVTEKTRLSRILLRPQIELQDLLPLPALEDFRALPEEYRQQVETDIKYESYIKRENEQAEKMSKLENIRLHKDFDYGKISSLSNESRQKLSALQPETIGHASRISGVSPSDISVLLVYFGR
jgi:tRNA uridine 5-carboxymethylaminomethyl modification enzyme